MTPVSMFIAISKTSGVMALVRIWKTTFLEKIIRRVPKPGLLHVRKYSNRAPVDGHFLDHSHPYFPVDLRGLPKSCTLFDLIEEIPQPGGFHADTFRATNRTFIISTSKLKFFCHAARIGGL